MEQVCPLCNGLHTIEVACRQCGTAMSDGGMVTDYYGDYSPYELTAHVRQAAENCVHLLYCESCGKQSYAVIHPDLF